jgi:hypothetical protein
MRVAIPARILIADEQKDAAAVCRNRGHLLLEIWANVLWSRMKIQARSRRRWLPFFRVHKKLPLLA